MKPVGTPSPTAFDGALCEAKREQKSLEIPPLPK